MHLSSGSGKLRRTSVPFPVVEHFPPSADQAAVPHRLWRIWTLHRQHFPLPLPVYLQHPKKMSRHVRRDRGVTCVSVAGSALGSHVPPAHKDGRLLVCSDKLDQHKSKSCHPESNGLKHGKKATPSKISVVFSDPIPGCHRLQEANHLQPEVVACRTQDPHEFSRTTDAPRHRPSNIGILILHLTAEFHHLFQHLDSQKVSTPNRQLCHSLSLETDEESQHQPCSQL